MFIFRKFVKNDKIMQKSKLLFIIVLVILIVYSCKKNPDDKSFNLFPLSKDIELGQQLSEEIAANPDEYPILSEMEYPLAYQHLRRIKDSILNSGEVFYKDDFVWEMKIIHNDSVLNAFCAPGGYIYVYTGIIKFLDTEDQFAGVLGHEIAHADRRHSTDQLTKAFGIQFLLGVLLGDDQDQLANIAASLLTLQFSRTDETEADEYSVKYLCSTSYNAAGAAGFFEKIENQSQGYSPVFLSTHPDPGGRVEDINANKNEFGCLGEELYQNTYLEFKNSLP